MLRFFALRLEDNVDPASRPSDVTPEVLKQAADLEYVSSRGRKEEEPVALESEEKEEAAEKAPETAEKSAEETTEASSEGSDNKEE